MSTTIMAALSLLVVVALVAVLLGFAQRLTRTLEHTGDTLTAGTDLATGIRRDCEHLVDGVLALNRNLGVAAAGLDNAVSAARARSSSLALPPRHREPPRVLVTRQATTPAAQVTGQPAQSLRVAWPAPRSR